MPKVQLERRARNVKAEETEEVAAEQGDERGEEELAACEEGKSRVPEVRDVDILESGDEEHGAGGSAKSINNQLGGDALSEEQTDPVVPHDECRERHERDISREEGREERVDSNVESVRELNAVVCDCGDTAVGDEQPVGDEPEDEGDAEGHEDEVDWDVSLWCLVLGIGYSPRTIFRARPKIPSHV